MRTIKPLMSHASVKLPGAADSKRLRFFAHSTIGGPIRSGARAQGTGAPTRLLLMATLTALVLTVTGCPPKGEGGPSVANWFRIQTSIAQALNEQWGGQRFRIACTRGAAYPIGTVFDCNSPSPLTDRCQSLDRLKAKIPVAPLPHFTAGTKFSVDLTVPDDWASAIGVGTARAGASVNNALAFSLAELTQVFVYEDAMTSVLREEPCLGSLDNLMVQDKIIVRGHIACKYRVSSVKKWSANAKIEGAKQDGLSITFDRDSGSFSIEQDTPFEWFTIFTGISVRRVVRELDPASRDFIAETTRMGQTPTAEQIREFIRENPDSVLQSLPEASTKDLDKLGAMQKRGKVDVVTLSPFKPDSETVERIVGYPPG